MKAHKFYISIIAAAFAVASFASTDALAQVRPQAGMKKRPPKTTGAKPEASEKGFTVGPDAATNYVIDTDSSRNEIVFVSKAPKETIKGKASKFAGTMSLNPRKVAEGPTGKFTVEWKNVDTNNPMRNTHLMGSPWVDTKAYPEIVFTITGIEISKAAGKTPGKSLKTRLLGKMSMNGKDKDVKIPATLNYLEKKGDVKEGLNIAAHFKVDLEDFGIKGKPGVVGQAVAKQEDVKVTLFMIPGTPKDDTPKVSAK